MCISIIYVSCTYNIYEYTHIQFNAYTYIICVYVLYLMVRIVVKEKRRGGGGGGTVCFGLKWSGGGLVVIDGEVFFFRIQ